MKFGKYIKDNKIVVIIWIMFFVITFSIFSVFRIKFEAIVMYAALWLFAFIFSILWDFFRKKNYYDELMNNTDGLDKKYFVSETMKEPSFYEGQIHYQVLQDINKSMIENVKVYENSVNDFKDYVEMWVHEVKLPILSLRLMCHNDKMDKKYVEQIKRIDDYTEQVLYFVRSENAKEDYKFTKVSLQSLIKNVAMKNKDMILENRINFSVKDVENEVVTDNKWMEFIINQIMSNSFKYMKDHGEKELKIYSEKSEEGVVLHILDNGIGIPKRDLSRVFNKSFTGENGRKYAKSTGMGLYIAKGLCEQLGHKIDIESEEGKYTEVRITFGKNDYFDTVV